MPSPVIGDDDRFGEVVELVGGDVSDDPAGFEPGVGPPVAGAEPHDVHPGSEAAVLEVLAEEFRGVATRSPGESFHRQRKAVEVLDRGTEPSGGVVDLLQVVVVHVERSSFC